jgi:hypothetical protein
VVPLLAETVCIDAVQSYRCADSKKDSVGTPKIRRGDLDSKLLAKNGVSAKLLVVIYITRLAYTCLVRLLTMSDRVYLMC